MEAISSEKHGGHTDVLPPSVWARLHVSLPRLQLQYQEAVAREHLARWQQNFATLKEKRDRLAIEFREFYPDAAAQLVDLLTDIGQLDIELSRLHSQRPANCAMHLDSAELVARGLDHFTAANPSIAAELKLPSFDRSGRPLWPLPAPPIASFMVPPTTSVGTDADWWKTREQRAADQQADRARMDNYYAEQQRVSEAAER